MSAFVNITYNGLDIAEYTENTTITLTNLLDPASFNLSNVTVSDGVYTFAANGVLAMITQSMITPTAGHLYYGRTYQKGTSGSTFADGRFEYYRTDVGGTGLMVFTSAGAATLDNSWHLNSSIQSLTGLYDTSNWILRSFTINQSSSPFYRKEMMIIDLTAAFGSGNEPTAAWCDANIPYFTGTTELVNISYNGSVLGRAAIGTSKTLNCSGKVMRSNIVVGSKTLNCVNKVMKGDVEVTAMTTKPDYLTFTAVTAASFALRLSNTALSPIPTIYYQIDGGSWQLYSFGTYFSLSAGSYVQFKGTNSSWSKSWGYFILLYINSGTVAASGNIMSVLDKTCQSTTIPCNFCFYSMFAFCGANLISAPKLPATTLTTCCYAEMFEGCTALTSVPSLPATNLATSCYYYMFNGCTSLIVSDTSGSGYSAAWRMPTSGTFSNTCSQPSMFTNCATGSGRASDDLAATSGSYCTYYTQNTPVS